MKVLTVDPGESTGFSTWEDGDLVYAGQADLDEFVQAVGRALDVHADYAPVNPVADGDLIDRLRGVEHVVIEDWSLYPWKLQSMAWDKCRTARAIGALEYICQVTSVPFTLQGAKIKESAVAGGAEELFLRPLHENRHANDAIMHGVFYHVTKGDA